MNTGVYERPQLTVWLRQDNLSRNVQYMKDKGSHSRVSDVDNCTCFHVSTVLLASGYYVVLCCVMPDSCAEFVIASRPLALV